MEPEAIYPSNSDFTLQFPALQMTMTWKGKYDSLKDDTRGHHKEVEVEIQQIVLEYKFDECAECDEVFPKLAR